MSDVKFYLSIFWRRFPYFFIVAMLVGTMGLAVAAVMPTTYRAVATLIVENPDIPEDMAASTVRAGANQQVEVIRQRLTTRSRLVELADELEVYGDDPERAQMEEGEIVADMRERMTFNVRNNDGATTVLVGFSHAEAESAAGIANQLAEMIEAESARMRRGAAGGTLDFFEDELERLSEEMSTHSSRILDFRLENIGALPGDLEYRRVRRDNLEERVRDLGREIRALRDERESMAELYQRTGELPGPTGQLTLEERELREARADLREALRIYSDQHPRVRQLRARVDDLQQAVGGGEEGEDPDDIFARMLAEKDDQIEGLSQEREELETEIADLREAIEATPENEVRLTELERSLENIRAQYAETQNRLAQAQMGERIETSARGQRINILERASVPTIPDSPSRRGLAAGSLGAGVGLGMGLVVLLELLNRSIRRPVEISNRLGITPIATLPYIRTRRQIILDRLCTGSLLLLVLVVIPVGLWAVHTQYMPLDLLIIDTFERLGFAEIVALFM